MISQHTLRRSLLSLLLCLAPAAALAQQASADQPVPGGQQQENLLIGPGDELHIQVFKRPELEQHVRVTDDGTISALLAGAITVRGLTPAQASLLIENRLLSGGFLLHPHVSISVDQFATQSIFVFGQVHTPTALVSPVARRVPEVLAQAGGLTEIASTHITIRRRATGELLEYHNTNDAEQELSQGMLVYPGDTVFVARAPMVYVLGNVAKPGGYAMDDNHGMLSALEALAAAGGSEPTASPAHTTLVRGTAGGGHVTLKVSLDDMRKGKVQDMPLQPDDILYIPFSNWRNVAVGLPGILSQAGSAAIYAVH